jgi:hypothetical protein
LVRRAGNTWQIDALGPDASRLTVAPQLELSLLGWLLRPVIALGLRRVARRTLDDFRHFVETGTPSARKRRHLARGSTILAVDDERHRHEPGRPAPRSAGP